GGVPAGCRDDGAAAFRHLCGGRAARPGWCRRCRRSDLTDGAGVSDACRARPAPTRSKPQGEGGLAEFMCHDPVLERLFDRVIGKYAEFQFYAWDDEREEASP